MRSYAKSIALYERTRKHLAAADRAMATLQ
jgi:hypothetical protein